MSLSMEVPSLEEQHLGWLSRSVVMMDLSLMAPGA